MADQWVLSALLAVQERLEAAQATEQLRIMSGMSDDEMLLLARLEAGAVRRKPSAPASLHGLISTARASVGAQRPRDGVAA